MLRKLTQKAYMTRTRVTRIVRVIFLVWLVFLVALVLTAIVTLTPLSDQRHGRDVGKPNSLSIQQIHRTLLCVGRPQDLVLLNYCGLLCLAVETDFDSFNSAGYCIAPTL